MEESLCKGSSQALAAWCHVPRHYATVVLKSEAGECHAQISRNEEYPGHVGGIPSVVDSS